MFQVAGIPISKLLIWLLSTYLIGKGVSSGMDVLQEKGKQRLGIKSPELELKELELSEAKKEAENTREATRRMSKAQAIREAGALEASTKIGTEEARTLGMQGVMLPTATGAPSPALGIDDPLTLAAVMGRIL